MAQYNFEGDISGISNKQFEFVNNIIKKHGFADSKVRFEPVGKAGDNYAASVKRIIAEDEIRSLTMIAKITPPVGDDVRKQMTSLVFQNEHFMYTEVLPKFVQLQKSAGVPEHELLRYAKCYGSSVEQYHEIILLEDLTLLDYKMLDRFQPLSNECVKSILKNFAILHSLSFALKDKEPETFDIFKASLFNLWTIQASAPEMKVFAQAIEDEAIAALDKPTYKTLVRDNITDFSNLVNKFQEIENESKYSVILQGDAWTNNIMFKLDKNVPESIMIDYQISRNSSPAYDIMYMIFNCTDHDTRKQHYYDWIHYYYSELEKSLLNFNLKADVVYPRDKLDGDLKLYGKLIFQLSVFLGSMLIRKSEDAEKFMESMNDINSSLEQQMEQFAISSLDDDTRSLFKKRVTGLIDSLLEFGLMQCT